jgi:hypothetical protein
MASECEKGEKVEEMEEGKPVEPVEEMEEMEEMEEGEEGKPVEPVEPVEEMEEGEIEQDEGSEEEEDVPEELRKVSGPSALMSPRPPNSDREFVLTGGGDLEFILTGGGIDGEDREIMNLIGEEDPAKVFNADLDIIEPEGVFNDEPTDTDELEEIPGSTPAPPEREKKLYDLLLKSTKAVLLSLRRQLKWNTRS